MKRLLSLMLLSSLAFGSDFTLCTINTDANSILSTLGIGVNQYGEISSFYSNSCQGDDCNLYDYPIEHISSGIVVEEGGGFDVITIFSDSFSFTEGGYLTIRYLSNGIWGTYEEFDLLLINSGGWKLFTMDGELVDHMYFLSRKFFAKVIGIQEVEFN